MKRRNKVRKIALLLYGLEGGGAERVMVTLANDWLARGFEVDFVLGALEGPYQDLLDDNLNIIVFNKRIRGLLPSIVRYLNQHQPDILLSTLQPMNTLAALAGKLSRSKTQIVLREANSPMQKIRYRSDWLKQLYFNLLPRFSYSFAAGHVAVSEGLRQEILSFYNMPSHKVKTIYNPIVSDSLYEMAEEEIAHPAFQQEGPVLMAMGRIAPQKDFPTLLRAFHLFQQKQQATQLLILGETKLNEDHYQDLLRLAQELNISEKVHFLGFQKNPFAFLKKADLFVLSSRFEGLPAALIQALALGCRVLSTDCPHGPNEILKQGKHGTLVAVGAVTDLAEAIETSLQQKRPAISIEQLSAPYLVSSASDSYLAYFDTLLNKNR